MASSSPSPRFPLGMWTSVYWVVVEEWLGLGGAAFPTLAFTSLRSWRSDLRRLRQQMNFPPR